QADSVRPRTAPHHAQERADLRGEANLAARFEDVRGSQPELVRSDQALTLYSVPDQDAEGAAQLQRELAAPAVESGSHERLVGAVASELELATDVLTIEQLAG